MYFMEYSRAVRSAPLPIHSDQYYVIFNMYNVHIYESDIQTRSQVMYRERIEAAQSMGPIRHYVS